LESPWLFVNLLSVKLRLSYENNPEFEGKKRLEIENWRKKKLQIRKSFKLLSRFDLFDNNANKFAV